MVSIADKSPRNSFIDDVVDNRKFLPSPCKYHVKKTWCAKDEDGRVRPKGAFL